MDSPHILHHGAASGVTSSCHQLLKDAANSLLVDRWLFQGAETSPDGKTGTERLTIDFSMQGISALFATYMHMDHAGRIPYLLAADFKGPIICSEPSAKVLPIALEDAFKLGISRNKKQVERYLKLLEQRIVAYWFSLVDTPALHARIRLQRAGHILGSAYVEIDLHYPESGFKKRIVFSGDLCVPYAQILPAPKAPYKADVHVIESTDRLHENRRTCRQRLVKILQHALSNQGTELFTAFSIGRTQELLYELEDIIHRKALKAPLPFMGEDCRDAGGRVTQDAQTEGVGRGNRVAAKMRMDSEAGGVRMSKQPHLDWSNLPISLDSPLASRFTRVYREFDHFWDAEAQSRLKSGRNPLAFRNLITVDDHRSHMAMISRLSQTAQPTIVSADNGICSSGRIVNYLKALLGDDRHDVLFVGYQAEGTTDRHIQRFARKSGYVEMGGQRYDIRAQVNTVGGYSAHADQKGLIGFVTRMHQWPSQVRIVHDEQGAKSGLVESLLERYNATMNRVALFLVVKFMLRPKLQSYKLSCAA